MQRSGWFMLASLLQRCRCAQATTSMGNLTTSSQLYSTKAYPNVLGATILERLPYLAPPDPKWEIEYVTWQEQLANKYRKDYPAQLSEVKPAVEVEGEDHDYYDDIYEIEDAENPDPRSPWRRLNQRIFFFVKLKGKENTWEFPFQQHHEGEFVRDTAMRALRDIILPAPKIYYVGHSPAGHYPVQNDQTLFFHRAQLIKGDVSLKQNPLYSDYAWVAKDELEKYVTDPLLLSLLRRML